MPRKNRKDPQRKRVYEWQWEWRDWNKANISLERAIKVVEHSCKIWKVPPPNAVERMSRKKGYSSYNDGHRTIRLLPVHMNTAMALHEVAHHIKEVRFGTAGGDHGPEWLGIFVDLLVDWNVAPREAIEASLTARGLKWSEVETSSTNKKGRKH